MKRKPTISFFCPAYNDEDNLPILIPKVIKLLKEFAGKFEVIIVDDASPDATGKVADKLAKRYSPYVHVVHHKENRDYGGALKSGYAHAKRYEYVFFTDGDNQYNVEELKKMLSYIPGYDAVLGYRSNRSLTWTRNVQSRVYNTIIRILFGIDSPDVNCAIRLIKKEYIQKMKLTADSAFLQAEILIWLNKLHARVKYIQVIHYPRIHGKASGGKPKVILHTLSDLVGYYISSN